MDTIMVEISVYPARQCSRQGGVHGGPLEMRGQCQCEPALGVTYFLRLTDHLTIRTKDVYQIRGGRESLRRSPAAQREEASMPTRSVDQSIDPIDRPNSLAVVYGLYGAYVTIDVLVFRIIQ